MNVDSLKNHGRNVFGKIGEPEKLVAMKNQHNPCMGKQRRGQGGGRHQQ